MYGVINDVSQILATGYLRLQALSLSLPNRQGEAPVRQNSEPGLLFPLDVSGHQMNVSNPRLERITRLSERGSNG